MLFPTTLWSKKYLLLDNPGLANAVAAYSSRKLRTAYTGSAMRVRRSNDNAEQDIGFTATGLLDTAALLAFTGSNNGYVTKWYDQSTGGNDVVQSTATAQPQIVSSGTVLTGPNSRPRLTFNGLMWLGTTSSPVNLNFDRTDKWSALGVTKCTDVSTNRFFIAKDKPNGTSGGWYLIAQTDSHFHCYIQNANASLYCERRGNTTISTSTNYLVGMINNGVGNAAGLTIRVNGAAETLTTLADSLGTNTCQSTAPFTVGSREIGNIPYVGDILEIIVWPVELTGSPLTTAEGSIKVFFNL